MADLDSRLANIHQRIALAARSSQREPSSIQLLAVSKGQSADSIRQAYRKGLRQFGENYLQEALPKMDALQGCDIQWHFIGPIQSNKTRQIAEHFDWAQSIDRLKIAERLGAQRPAWASPLNVCVQVNISREPNKAGVMPEQTGALCTAIAGLSGLKLRGLMFLPAANNARPQQAETFAAARRLFDDLNEADLPLDCLSMGMSADLEAAIHAGSTLLRIGTALFGPRS